MSSPAVFFLGVMGGVSKKGAGEKMSDEKKETHSGSVHK